MIDIYFPSAAKVGSVLAVFVALLVVVHFAFVWPRNLSKKSWRYIDYLWLAFAAIGLVGALANVRMYIAEKELVNAEIRTANFYGLFRNILEVNARDNGYVCREFIRAKFSPPDPEFSDAQREFDRVCVWLKQVEKTIPKSPSTREGEVVELEKINPMTMDKSLVDVLEGLRDQYSYYVEADSIYRKLQVEAKPTNLEVSFSFLAPWMLALALAFRIAKVSGELRYEV